MANNLDFKIKCEGDCERVSKVFVEWLKTNSPELKKRHSIEAPSSGWAIFFSEIYANEVENNNLSDKAEQNVIQIDFSINSPNGVNLSDLSNEQLLELLEEYLEEQNEEDNDESEEY
jgi:hypothetical protein